MIDHEYHSDSDGDSHFIRYAYAVDGQRYEHRERVSEEIYNEIVSGGSFFVTYNQVDPDVATIGEPSLLSLGISSAFAGIFSLIGWSMLFGSLRSGAMSKHLSERGLLLAGQVVHARGRIDEEEHTERDSLWLDVTYTFVSPKTQKDIRGKVSNTRPELRGSRGKIGRMPGIFAPGDPLLIMYADDRRHTVL